jgi:hypothetical protein
MDLQNARFLEPLKAARSVTLDKMFMFDYHVCPFSQQLVISYVQANP